MCGVFGAVLPDGDPTIERKLFLSSGPQIGLAGILSDRSLPYLLLGAVGRRVPKQ